VSLEQFIFIGRVLHSIGRDKISLLVDHGEGEGIRRDQMTDDRIL
jgi:hypothetical protein